jgi:predicted ribosome quality control (RQC) complex YloA/Tae2 family protein
MATLLKREIKDMKEVRFRQAFTSSGRLMLAGKDAEQNEALVWQAGESETVLHTKAAGSPFVNIKGEKKVSVKDVNEAAVFCARYSRDWKKNHGDVEVHVFLRKDISKEKGMKLGTFGVKKFRKIVIKKDILRESEKMEKKKQALKEAME